MAARRNPRLVECHWPKLNPESQETLNVISSERATYARILTCNSTPSGKQEQQRETSTPEKIRLSWTEAQLTLEHRSFAVESTQMLHSGQDRDSRDNLRSVMLRLPSTARRISSKRESLPKVFQLSTNRRLISASKQYSEEEASCTSEDTKTFQNICSLPTSSSSSSSLPIVTSAPQSVDSVKVTSSIDVSETVSHSHNIAIARPPPSSPSSQPGQNIPPSPSNSRETAAVGESSLVNSTLSEPVLSTTSSAFNREFPSKEFPWQALFQSFVDRGLHSNQPLRSNPTTSIAAESSVCNVEVPSTSGYQHVALGVDDYFERWLDLFEEMFGYPLKIPRRTYQGSCLSRLDTSASPKTYFLQMNFIPQSDSFTYNVHFENDFFFSPSWLTIFNWRPQIVRSTPRFDRQDTSMTGGLVSLQVRLIYTIIPPLEQLYPLNNCQQKTQLPIHQCKANNNNFVQVDKCPFCILPEGDSPIITALNSDENHLGANQLYLPVDLEIFCCDGSSMNTCNVVSAAGFHPTGVVNSAARVPDAAISRSLTVTSPIETTTTDMFYPPVSRFDSALITRAIISNENFFRLNDGQNPEFNMKEPAFISPEENSENNEFPLSPTFIPRLYGGTEDLTRGVHVSVLIRYPDRSIPDHTLEYFIADASGIVVHVYSFNFSLEECHTITATPLGFVGQMYGQIGPASIVSMGLVRGRHVFFVRRIGMVRISLRFLLDT